MRVRASFAIVAALSVGLCSTVGLARPARGACPAQMPADARCYYGADGRGGYYWAAIPARWNRRLIVYAHGGPRLAAPRPDDSRADLARYGPLVARGYAWIGSTYRRAGFGVRSAAADVDRSWDIFQRAFGTPARTYLHGQSWGGAVVLKVAELHNPSLGRSRRYDGVLVTSGVVSSGTRAYAFRAGLRAVYSYVCGNHPAPDENSYPPWQGLPRGASMAATDLASRIGGCTGIGLPTDRRTGGQRARLADLTAVMGIAERDLVAQISWATFQLQDLVWNYLGGRNPFSNVGTVYRGSRDDKALNAGVMRFAADPVAVAALDDDSAPTGRIDVPTMTLHALHDPTMPIATELDYGARVAGAGRAAWLVQVTTSEREHAALSSAEYVAMLLALDGWVSSGVRPTDVRIERLCAEATASLGTGCWFQGAPAEVIAGRDPDPPGRHRP